jgi:hypothetical protein
LAGRAAAPLARPVKPAATATRTQKARTIPRPPTPPAEPRSSRTELEPQLSNLDGVQLRSTQIDTNTVKELKQPDGESRVGRYTLRQILGPGPNDELNRVPGRWSYAATLIPPPYQGMRQLPPPYWTYQRPVPIPWVNHRCQYRMAPEMRRQGR